jgi:hypothetical protein
MAKRLGIKIKDGRCLMTFAADRPYAEPEAAGAS